MDRKLFNIENKRMLSIRRVAGVETWSTSTDVTNKETLLKKGESMSRLTRIYMLCIESMSE